MISGYSNALAPVAEMPISISGYSNALAPVAEMPISISVLIESYFIWMDHSCKCFTVRRKEKKTPLKKLIIGTPSAVNDLLYSSRNVKAVMEQMSQIDDTLNMLLFKNKIHN